MKAETEYKLKHGLKYSFAGEKCVAEYVLLQEPDYTNPESYYKLQDTITLSQAKLLNSISKEQIESLQEEVQPGLIGEQKKFHEQDREFDIEEQIEGLKMGLRLAEKTYEFIKTFKNMVIKSRLRCPAIVDGQENMTDALFSKMHPRDLEGMALRWAAFFILASEDKERKSSEKVLESPTEATEL